VLYNAQTEKLNEAQPVIVGAAAATVTAKYAGMTVNGVFHAEKEPAAKALLEACKGVTERKDLAVGSYMSLA